MKLAQLTLLFVFLHSQGAHADGFLKGFDALWTHLDKASGLVKPLEKQLAEEKTQGGQARLSLALGILLYKTGQLDAAEKALQKSLDLGTRLTDYAEFFLGRIEVSRHNWEGARKRFLKIKKPEAELQLALLAQEQEKWAESIRYLKSLEKKYRRDPEQYPEVLMELFQAAKAKGAKSDACYAALKIYSKYPLLGIEKGWGEDLSGGASGISCPITRPDIHKRFIQLLLHGELAQLRKEVLFWQTKLRQSNDPHPQDLGFLESQLGRAALAEGKTSEAIQHVLTSQDMVGKDFDSQMLLGRAYSQTDNYPAAAQAYMQAYKFSPRSKQGHQALFQAAFLSYQNLDYDGAARKFEDLIKMTRGKMAWHSQWHLAWIRYLKEDYDGALKAFQVLAQKKRIDRVDEEKLQYWRAMSLYRLGFIEEARPIFKNLAEAKRLGYYTAAAQARLSSLPAEKNKPELKELKPYYTTMSLAPIRGPANSADEEQSQRTHAEPASSEGGEILSSETTEGSVNAMSSDGDESLLSGPLDYSVVKDPSLSARFDRVKDLIELGFAPWAKSELHEIEKRTRNIHYLELLVSEYSRVGEFNRAAYLADVVFAVQREKENIEGAPRYWNYAFPQAYNRFVIKYAKKFDVSPFLVWSIMRGESNFKESVVSSAGAVGLMQLILPTAKRVAQKIKLGNIGKENLSEPETNITLGTWYLWRLNKIMGQTLPLAIASYNAGPHRVMSWVNSFGQLDLDEFIEHIPYVETRNYVKKVLRNYFVYLTLYEKKSNSLSWLTQKSKIKFNGPKLASENWDE